MCKTSFKYQVDLYGPEQVNGRARSVAWYSCSTRGCGFLEIEWNPQDPLTCGLQSVVTVGELSYCTGSHFCFRSRFSLWLWLFAFRSYPHLLSSLFYFLLVGRRGASGGGVRGQDAIQLYSPQPYTIRQLYGTAVQLYVLFGILPFQPAC